MSCLPASVSKVIDLDSLFPKAQGRPIASKVIEGAKNDGLNGEYLLLNGKTSKLIKMLRPGQRLEQLYEQLNGKGKKAYFAFSRLHPERPSRTIAKDSAGLFHYLENRTLSIGEYKRIASYPDEFQFIGVFTTALERIGNSVPPLFIRAIALQIKNVLFNGEPLTPYPQTMTYLDILEQAWQDHLKPREPDAPIVISLFSGGGGSSLGYSMAGYRELLAVEWDNNAVETFRLNFPDVPVYHGDIAKLSIEECLKLAGIELGQLDLLDGSPPCQGFSTAGKRIMDDPRNQLFREYVRLLRGLQPKVFVMENVSGMVKGKMKLIFVEILKELKASGYRVSARLMNAMYFNVPQSRERMIFIGVREDLGIGPSHPRAEDKGISPKIAFANCPDDEVKVLPDWLKEAAKYMDAGNYNHQSVERAFLKVRGNKAGSQNTKLLSWDRTSCTLVKEEISVTGIIHPNRERYLTIAEMKRIASYPDSFQFAGKRKDKVARIGNSVPPLLSRSIARHIRQHILTGHKTLSVPPGETPRRVSG